jgi:Reverse transcriptase (RNA-dependent DNA polymerase)
MECIDRPRPRAATANLKLTNHGGVAVLSSPGVKLTPVPTVTDSPSTFEFVCSRATAGQFKAIVTVIYRPGSDAIEQSFFDEVGSLLDCVAAFHEPIFIVDDFNVRLDRVADPGTCQFNELLACRGLSVRPTSTTHRDGGTIDAVIVRDDMLVGKLNRLDVAVVDVDLSDHHLLTWSVVARQSRQQQPMQTFVARPWRSLDVEQLRAELCTSPLCQPDSWPSDVDEMAALYDIVLTAILDRLIPLRTIVRRPRASDPWFDGDCRQAKRVTRRLERAYSAACRRAATGACTAAVADDAKTAWYDQRRRYRELLQSKRSSFWCETIETERSSPQKLWKSVDQLLGRGNPPASSAISVDDYNRFFAEKVNLVRERTAGAAEPSYTPVHPGTSLSAFSCVSVADVITAITRLPNKSSAADPLPVPLMKQVGAELSPFLCELFNRSMLTGQFPATFKQAFITPVIKKSGLDAADVGSYRPISNLSVISKLLERIVAKQLGDYLQSADLLPSVQSGFRPCHSTETATLRVLSDLLTAVDDGCVAALVLLDLSAAFDTVDHAILCQRLQSSFGVTGPALCWFESYLHGRSQYIRRGQATSAVTALECGVPQGSVLGPLLFIVYTADLISLVEQHGFHPHLYADDTQVYGSCRPSAVTDFQLRLSACIDDVASWMRMNRLQLNTSKTDLLWCATARRQHQLPSTSLRVGPDVVQPSTCVRDLGIFFDADLSMRTQVQRTVAACFAALRKLRSIRRSVPAAVYQTLVTVLVLSRLDYGNATLIGIPSYQCRQLQSVLNAAARSVAGLRRSDHISQALANLHWLRAPERIQFKLASLVYRSLHGSAPRYLADDLLRVADIASRRRLRSASTQRLDVPRARLTTVGDRTFRVAGSRLWNSLPADVVDCQTFALFRRRLKHFLFSLSFPDIRPT